MATEKLFTVRDVAIYLNLSEKEIIDLAENGTIPAYKVGGVYLRFKREQVEEYRKSQAYYVSKGTGPQEDSPAGKLVDFFYFHDFYLISALLIALILVIIFRG